MWRNKQALIPYLLLILALAGGMLWHESELVPGLGRTVTTGVADVGGPFRLTDQNGKTVTDQDFRGRYMLIYFGYSFCPDVCPTTLGVMAEALQKLGPQEQPRGAGLHHHRSGTRHAQGAGRLHEGVRAAICRPHRQ